MEKQPFTPAGVLALQQWLYQLPPVEFDTEILAMETDFETWSLAHLALDNNQLTFYNQLSSVAQYNLAYTITLAAMFKKPVSLVQLVQNSNEPDSSESDKLFKPKSTITITSNSDGNDVVEGDVEIEVTYLS
ncbi:hypothetical protein WG904_08160 [Pedobacter sp. Du54]|uniref:hypothetical protein n=1 Tax=Pedobacter anseongensis TaxID=3133439 RepID=UPI0030B16A37